MNRPAFAAALAALAALAATAAPPAFAGGDAALGKRVFNKCLVCHDATNQIDKVGPHLSGVVGRKAGTAASFLDHYSQAMKDAGAAGLVWDEANLAEFLRAPRDRVPGTRMTFAGLRKDEDIANVIAYLEADPKP